MRHAGDGRNAYARRALIRARLDGLIRRCSSPPRPGRRRWPWARRSGRSMTRRADRRRALRRRQTRSPRRSPGWPSRRRGLRDRADRPWRRPGPADGGRGEPGALRRTAWRGTAGRGGRRRRGRRGAARRARCGPWRAAEGARGERRALRLRGGGSRRRRRRGGPRGGRARLPAARRRSAPTPACRARRGWRPSSTPAPRPPGSPRPTARRCSPTAPGSMRPAPPAWRRRASKGLTFDRAGDDLAREAARAGERREAVRWAAARGRRRAFRLTAQPLDGGQVGVWSEDVTEAEEAAESLKRALEAQDQTLNQIREGRRDLRPRPAARLQQRRLRRALGAGAGLARRAAEPRRAARSPAPAPPPARDRRLRQVESRRARRLRGAGAGRGPLAAARRAHAAGRAPAPPRRRPAAAVLRHHRRAEAEGRVQRPDPGSAGDARQADRRGGGVLLRRAAEAAQRGVRAVLERQRRPAGGRRRLRGRRGAVPAPPARPPVLARPEGARHRSGAEGARADLGGADHRRRAASSPSSRGRCRTGRP